jgi:SAM-dependent methyltransferase
MDRKRLVERGYDRMAEHYLASKVPLSPAIEATLAALTAGLGDGAAILDLGCGAGVPVTQWLAARFAVTGVDLSARQLALARENVPGATFLKADMGAVNFPAGAIDAVVALYAIIHLPREEVPTLLARIARWLRPGGRFLATWPLDAWEGEEADWQGWGAPMWWSHHGADDNLALLRDAGFAISSAARLTEGGETWLWVLARRPESSPGQAEGDRIMNAFPDDSPVTEEERRSARTEASAEVKAVVQELVRRVEFRLAQRTVREP